MKKILIHFLLRDKIMKKLFIYLGFALLPISAQALVELPKLTIEGHVDSQAGYVSQKKPFKFENVVQDSEDTSQYKIVSKKVHYYGIVNDTKLTFKINGRINSEFTYGGEIKINADTSRDADDNDDNVGNKTFLFVESANMGRFEMGAMKSPSESMQVSAATFAAATGGIDGAAPKWVFSNNSDGSSISSKFVKWPESLTNCNCISFANKAVYYTPQIAGFQVGVSYTPDIGVHGTVTELKATPKRENQNFKQIFDYGLGYENKFNDIEFKIAFTGQHGKSKVLNIARKNLNSWELGANVKFKGVTLGGSYSDWGKSATPSVKASNKKYGAKFWTLGAGYEYANIESSVTYFHGKRANVYTTNVPLTIASHDIGYSKSEYISGGAAYKGITGFKPYAEVTHFKYKLYGSNLNNSGFVTLIGTKISI